MEMKELTTAKLASLLGRIHKCGVLDCVYCERIKERILAEHDQLWATIGRLNQQNVNLMQENENLKAGLAHCCNERRKLQEQLKQAKQHHSDEYHNRTELENERLKQGVPWEDALWTVAQGQEKQIKELKAKASALDGIVEPLSFQNHRMLRDIVAELKQRDGEHWAIGEIVERLLDYSVAPRVSQELTVEAEIEQIIRERLEIHRESMSPLPGRTLGPLFVENFVHDIMRISRPED